jgi:hypothetical protein
VQVEATVADDGFPSGGVRDVNFVHMPPGQPKAHAAPHLVDNSDDTRGREPSQGAAAGQQPVGVETAVHLPSVFKAGQHLTAAKLQFGTLYCMSPMVSELAQCAQGRYATKMLILLT